MPYALFCQNVKISRAYPTEADVWRHASQNDLVDVASAEEQPTPKPALDNDYEIRKCEADAPEKNHDAKVTDFVLPFPT
ncbi:MAG: hypothetical protein HY242_08785 [Afipia sp.]|nr:hypothetical protein [Afipia sp.]